MANELGDDARQVRADGIIGGVARSTVRRRDDLVDKYVKLDAQAFDVTYDGDGEKQVAWRRGWDNERFQLALAKIVAS